jgi:4-hydroxy-3-polyprenylbenzoate decarboxylase
VSAERSVLVAITGASGVAYGARLLERLAGGGSRTAPTWEAHLTISHHALPIIEQELGRSLELSDDAAAQLLAGERGVRSWHPDDLSAPFASGAGVADAMVIVPCSLGTAGRIAAGVSHDLITRAADVALKEHRRVVLVPRETPLNVIHLRNLLTLAEAGAVILPAMPGFYRGPKSVDDLVDFVVDKILDAIGTER